MTGEKVCGLDLLAVLAAMFVALLDISDVVLALAGGVGYLLLRKAASKPITKVTPRNVCDDVAEGPVEKPQTLRRERKVPSEPVLAMPDQRQASVVLVVCPSFATSDWDGQVCELLKMLTPTE